MEFLKTITGRIVTGAIALAVIAGGISWWRMDEATRQEILGGTGHILAWTGVVLAWPWVSFGIVGRVAKMESNMAGAVLVTFYTLLEVALLGWLFHWHIDGSAGWTSMIFGGLVAGVYNLLACDWIAEKLV